MTTTPSQCENYPKSVMYRLTHPPKEETTQNQSLLDTKLSQLKINPKHGFQDHHILQRQKLLKISPFKTAIPSLSTNC